MEILRNIKLNGANNKPMLADVFFKTGDFNKPVVLFNHGFKGFKDYGCWNLVAEAFANEGFVFVKFNQSHNGTTIDQPEDFADLEAFGNNTISNELFDIAQMIKWIKGNNAVPTDFMNADDISIIGHSRGGGTAILAANVHSEIKKLITWASFKDIAERYKGPSFEEWKSKGVVYIENSRTKQQMPLYYSIFEDYKTNEEQYLIENACKAIAKPQLIIHGTEDPTVIFQDALKLKSWNKNAELFLIPNANHVFGASHPYKEDTLPTDLEKVVKESIRFLKAN